MNKETKEITTLRNLLIQHNFYIEFPDQYHSGYWFTEEDLGVIEKVMPPEGIQRITDRLNYSAARYHEASDAYVDLRDNGYLSFQPKVLDNGKRPVLALGWTKYLIWTPYKYRIAYTPAGQGELFSGSENLEYLTWDTKNSMSYANHDLRFVNLCCFLEVLCHFSQGRKLLETNKDIIDTYLTQAACDTKINNNTLSDFYRYLTVRESRMQLSIDEAFPELSDKVILKAALEDYADGHTYGLLCVNKRYVAVVTHPNKEHYVYRLLQLPEWLTAEHDRHYHAAIRALLSISGFCTNLHDVYPIGTRRGDILPVTYNVAGCITKYQDIEDLMDECLTNNSIHL